MPRLAHFDFAGRDPPRTLARDALGYGVVRASRAGRAIANGAVRPHAKGAPSPQFGTKKQYSAPRRASLRRINARPIERSYIFTG